MWKNSKSIDQKTDRRFQQVAARILACAPHIARQGTLVAGWRSYRGHKLGPYWRVAFCDDGGQKSIYLGRSESLVQRVRDLLEDLKRPERERKNWRRIEEQGRAALRRHKKLWDRELRACGLYSRGYGVRGMGRLLRAARQAARMARRLRMNGAVVQTMVGSVY